MDIREQTTRSGVEGWGIPSRTLMKTPFAKRQTTPESGFCSFFSAFLLSAQ